MIHSGDRYINPLTDFGFKRINEPAEIAKFSSNERREYELSINAYRDIKNGMESAKKEGLEKGIAIGTEKGIAIGTEKGIAIGTEKGIAIGKEAGKKDIATKMKAKGMPIDIISEITGLTEKDIEEI